MTTQEKHKIATAVWILSCNDKIPMMLYQSMFGRLNFTDIDHIKSIVQNFPELFKIQIKKDDFERWQKKMSLGSSRPRWIARKENPKQIISTLKIEDTFINRFRGSSDSPAVDHEILKWGLEYIDEYYAIPEREKDKKYNRIGSVILPLISVLVAGMAISLTHLSNKEQRKFELIKTNRELIIPSYHKFLNSINKTFYSAGPTTDLDKLYDDFANLRTAIYELRPFLNDSTFNLAIDRSNEYQESFLQLRDKDSLYQEKISEAVKSYDETQRIINEAIMKEIYVKNN